MKNLPGLKPGRFFFAPERDLILELYKINQHILGVSGIESMKPACIYILVLIFMRLKHKYEK
jgi:hypothetical protein